MTQKAPKISDQELTLSGDRIFFSIQGEGVSIGQPAIFLRLHMCNLDCQWCDTPYTWDKRKDEYWNEWKQFSITEVCDLLFVHPCTRLVITGGEPLLQQTAICKLVQKLAGWRIEIETNGTITPDNYLLENCQFNISPKLANSGVAKERRIKSSTLNILKSAKNHSFKFVVENSQDLHEVDELVMEFSLSKESVIIMPQGKNESELNSRMLELADQIKTKGYRLLPRLHVYIWGNQRAV